MSKQKPQFGHLPNLGSPSRDGLVLDLAMLDEGDLNDYSLNGNNGTNNGATWVAGPSGPALDFDSTDNQYLILSNDAAQIGSGDFTAVAWVQNNGTAAFRGVLATKLSGSIGARKGYILGIDSGHDAYWTVDDGAGTGVVLNASSNDLSIGDHFIAGTFKQGQEMTVYVDGVVTQQSTTGIPSGDLTSIETTKVGAFALPNFYFNGNIYNVMAFRRCLDAQEIEALYDNPFPDEVWGEENLALWAAATQGGVVPPEPPASTGGYRSRYNSGTYRTRRYA